MLLRLSSFKWFVNGVSTHNYLCQKAGSHADLHMDAEMS